MTTANNIVRLADTDLDMNEIIETVSNSFYSISVYDASETTLPKGVTPETLSTLEEDTVYFAPQGEEHFPYALLRVRDSYVIMTPHSDNNELVNFRSSAITAPALLRDDRRDADVGGSQCRSPSR